MGCYIEDDHSPAVGSGQRSGRARRPGSLAGSVPLCGIKGITEHENTLPPHGMSEDS
jgi:hypothetical protein